jgi:hypothetical protein
MTRGVGYSAVRDPNVIGVSSSGVSGSGVVAVVSESSYTVSTVTWNPAKKGENIGLTGGNLIATNTQALNDWDSVHATGSASTGKKYYEVVLNNMPFDGDFMVGVATAVAGVISYLGSDVYSWAWQFGGTTTAKHTGAVQGVYGTTGVTTNDVVGVLLDLATGELSFTLNGVSQGVAYSGLTGTLFPAAALYYLNPAITARFDPSSWSYTPPAGYDSWH